MNWLPGIVTFGVSFPLHKVLERSGPSMTSVVDQVFDLVLFGAFDEVRWGPREIGAVNGVFLVW